MPRIAFKHADPTRRTPTYLQAHTVENFKWQLKLTALFFVYIGLKEWYDERQYQKKYGRKSTLPH